MGEHMRDNTRQRRKLELRREKLRVLDVSDLDRVAGGHSLARVGTRYCIWTYDP